MDIKKILGKTTDFAIKRIVELFGVFLILLSLFLLISLFSYSPDDPNFIFPENKEIKNLFGKQGSYTSDFFFQSLGLISLLIPLTIFFTGTNIFKNKKILILIENLFFIVVYSFIGSFFFSVYYDDSFWLAINGNGGYVGNYLNETFLFSIIKINIDISFYLLIIILTTLFLLSINFKPKYLFLSFSFILKLFNRKKQETKIESEENIFNENDNKENNNLVQENLPFSSPSNDIKKPSLKFELPKLNFLKSPSKEERGNNINEKVDESFLEKILLDFGVEGKIKKISHGPVVTLNEFEPAAGVKV